jgi:hypothetical protein
VSLRAPVRTAGGTCRHTLATSCKTVNM